MAQGPKRTAQVLLVASAAGLGYVDYFVWRNVGLGAPGALDSLLAGTGPAPEQYRVGVVWLVHALATGLQLKLPAAMATIDGLSALGVFFLLLAVLERTEVYRAAGRMAQWFGAAALVVLVEWFIAWLELNPKPETMVAALLVAVMFCLWLPGPRRGVGTSLLLLGLSVILATVRADVACCVNVGLAIAASGRERLALTKPVAVATGATGAVAAGAMQLWLMRVAFPAAGYGSTPLWQLRANGVHASRWIPFVVFLLPIAWGAVQVVRRRFRQDGAGVAMLAGAAVYLVLWVTVGKVDEVRIFLPFALGLTPLLAQMAMLLAEAA